MSRFFLMSHSITLFPLFHTGSQCCQNECLCCVDLPWPWRLLFWRHHSALRTCECGQFRSIMLEDGDLSICSLYSVPIIWNTSSDVKDTFQVLVHYWFHAGIYWWVVPCLVCTLSMTSLHRSTRKNINSCWWFHISLLAVVVMHQQK